MAKPSPHDEIAAAWYLSPAEFLRWIDSELAVCQISRNGWVESRDSARHRLDEMDTALQVLSPPPGRPNSDEPKVIERYLQDLKSWAIKLAAVQTTHSDDFRSVNWFGTEYCFTVNQAPVVSLLWDHFHRRAPDVADETLLSAVDEEAPPKRLNALFREHPAWGTMIVPGKTKGTHRLCAPN